MTWHLTTRLWWDWKGSHLQDDTPFYTALRCKSDNSKLSHTQWWPHMTVIGPILWTIPWWEPHVTVICLKLQTIPQWEPHMTVVGPILWTISWWGPHMTAMLVQYKSPTQPTSRLFPPPSPSVGGVSVELFLFVFRIAIITYILLQYYYHSPNWIQSN